MANQGLKQPFGWCAVFCLLLNPIAVVTAAEYEVDGEIEQTLYKMDGSVQLEEHSKFTVFVRDCSWLIQTALLDKDGKPFLKNETACTNGTLICSVEGGVEKNNAPRGGRGTSGLTVANTYSNNVPVGQDDGYFICHLWLMFASGCYFENITSNRLTPAYDSNASVAVNPNLKREARWELINGVGSLPLNITYLEGPFHDTDATYAATGVTNVGNLKIPSGFIFEVRIDNRLSKQFAPGPIEPGESVPAYRVRKRAIATVMAVQQICTRSELMPQAQGKTMVIDERLAQPTNPTPVFYNFQNGVRWVSVEEAKKLAIPQTPQREQNPTVARAVFFVLLLLPSMVFVYFLTKTERK